MNIESTPQREWEVGAAVYNIADHLMKTVTGNLSTTTTSAGPYK